MNTRTFVHRSVAVLASTGAAATLALLPSIANATVKANYFAEAESSAHYVGPTSGGTCTLTSPSGSDDVSSTPIAFSHGTKHTAVSINSRYASSDNSSDQVTVKGRVKSVLTLKRVHNDLRSLDLTALGSMTVSHTMSGSACQGSGDAFGEVETLFTEHKKGTFTLTRDLVPNSASIFVLINETTGKEVVFDLSQTSGTSHATYTAKLKPGSYAVEAENGVTGGSEILLKAAPRTTKVSLKSDIHATFTPKKKKKHHHHH